MKTSFQSLSSTLGDQILHTTIIKCLVALSDENEDVVEKMKKKMIGELTNNSEYDTAMNEERIKTCLLRCDGQLERAWIISVYVMSQFSRNLPGAFAFVEQLKKESDDRNFLYMDDESINSSDDGIEVTAEDCKVTFPLLGALVGVTKPVKDNRSAELQKQDQPSVVIDILDDDELAGLAGVGSGSEQQFGEYLEEFLRDIEQMEKKEKSFFGNFFSGKYINGKTVTFLVVLGFLCWWYKLFLFTNISFVHKYLIQ